MAGLVCECVPLHPSPRYVLAAAAAKALSLPHCFPSCLCSLGPSPCFLGNTVALCSLLAVGTLDLVTGAVAGKVVFPGMAHVVESKGLL